MFIQAKPICGAKTPLCKWVLFQIGGEREPAMTMAIVRIRNNGTVITPDEQGRRLGLTIIKWRDIYVYRSYLSDPRLLLRQNAGL